MNALLSKLSRLLDSDDIERSAISMQQFASKLMSAIGQLMFW